MVRQYCESRNIEIPVEFGRNSVSRYVIIMSNLDLPVLVATTWFTKPDVVHYLRLTNAPTDATESAKVLSILDFKFMKSLIWDGKRLTVGEPFVV